MSRAMLLIMVCVFFFACSNSGKRSQDANPLDSSEIGEGKVADGEVGDTLLPNDGKPGSDLADGGDGRPDQEAGVVDAGPCSPRREVFTQTANRKVDVLFVVDAGGSMAQEAQRIAAVGGIIQHLAVIGKADYHFGLVPIDGTPQGKLYGTPSYYKNGQGNIAPAIATALVKIRGTGFERAFDAIKGAITPPMLGGANKGFRRADASFEAIVFTDEVEGSTMTATAAIAFFRGLTDAKRQVFARLHAVIPSASCAQGVTFAKYRAVSKATGGTIGDLCAQNYSAVATTIAGRSFGLSDTFVLAGTPATSSLIVVKVDGKATTAFSFKPDINAIVFTNPPADGAKIAVSYPPACD